MRPILNLPAAISFLTQIFVIIGIVMVTEPVKAAGVAVPSGLIAWWPFEGSGADVSGRGHEMSLFGAPAFGAGEVSQAVVIDGANDYGRVAAHNDLDLGANQGLTMEMWINPASTTIQQPLLEWTDNNTIVGLHFWISVVSYAGGGNGSLFVNVTDRNGVAHHVSSSPGVVLPNVFTHVAMTYSKTSGLAKLYANGQVVASQNVGQITPETRHALYAGWRPIGGEWRYTGKLDEISLYNRELSLQELAAIAAAGPAGKTNGNNPPPPPPPTSAMFDLAGHFSTNHNPNGVWTYGYAGTLTGSVTALPYRSLSPDENEILVPGWQFSSVQTPAVYQNPSSTNVVISSGHGVLPARSIWFYPGENGRPENYGVIRFTAPSNSNYAFNGAAVPVYDTSLQGDTDFHIVKNGVEFLGVFLAGAQSSSFSEVIALNANDRLDFFIGRGADNNQFASGLRIAVGINPTTNAATVTVTNSPPPPPPPPTSAMFDLAGHFSTNNNPNVVWTYGYAGTLTGSVTALPYRSLSPDENGILVPGWQLSSVQTPAVYQNPSSTNVVISSGHGILPAHSIWFVPGENGRPENYGVIRFTAPSNSNYAFNGAAVPVYDAGFQGDTDFHIVKNGVEFLGVFLAAAQSSSFSEVIALNANDRLDFFIGRGADNNQFASGLRIAVGINPTTNPATVTVTNPPPPPPPTNGVAVPSGLVAWWPFEGNGVDVSGRGHDMSLFGSPAFGSGEVGQAIVIDGANDYGRVAAHGHLDLGTNQGLTIEMWINPASTTIQQPLLEWTDDNTIVGLHFWISVVSYAGGGNGSLFANVTDRNGVAHHVSSSPGVVLPNVFTHVAMTYSKTSGLAKLYANGQVVASQNVGQITPETRHALYAGWRPIGGEWRYTGKLDEISLYNRELSLQELAAIAAAGPAGKTNGNNPPLPGPQITSHPESVTTRPGSNASFHVEAVGASPLAYQWLHNGSPIAGETNTSLVIDPTKPPQEGIYAVVVTNPFGSVTSSNATLTIIRSRRSLLTNSGTSARGRYEFVLDGEAGVRYAIEASENLQDWSKIDEVTATGTPIRIQDSNASDFSRRFYRAVPLIE